MSKGESMRLLKGTVERGRKGPRTSVAAKTARIAGALAVGAALTLFVVGASASTSGAAATGWSLASTTTPGEAPLPATNASGAAPAANPNVELNDVASLSSSFVVAVGSYADAGGAAQRDGLIETFSSGSWTSIAAPEPSTNAAGVGPGTDADLHQSANLSAVTCAGAGGCVAVGTYTDANGRVYGLIDVLSGGTWTATAAPEPSTNGFGTGPGTDTGATERAALDAVTCASSASCVAVGFYYDTDGNRFGLIDTLASGTWSAAAAPEPSTDQVSSAPGYSALGAGVATLSAVACESTTSCVAVGDYNDADSNTLGLIETLSSGSWSPAVAPEPATNALGTGPGYSALGAGLANLVDLACPATGSCVAVGHYNDTNAKVYGLIETLASGAWTGTAAPEPSTNAAGVGPGTDGDSEGHGDLSSVECTSATSCVAVGNYKDTGGFAYGLIDTLAGTSWSALSAPEPGNAGTDADTFESASLASVSCGSPGDCAAVGTYTDSTSPGYQYGLAENLALGTWSATSVPEPTNAGTDADLHEKAAPNAVSCSDDGACVLVGTYQDASANTLGLLDVYTPLPPTVHAISPRTGTDGRKVTIAGTGFTPSSTVHFGRLLATGVTYLSSVRMQAIAPVFHKTVDVTVTNAAGASAPTSGDRFTYVSPVTFRALGSFVDTTGVVFTWNCSRFIACHAARRMAPRRRLLSRERSPRVEQGRSRSSEVFDSSRQVGAHSAPSHRIRQTDRFPPAQLPLRRGTGRHRHCRKRAHG